MASQIPITISKSRYLSGLQCAKRVWTEQHARQLLPLIEPSTQATFDQGHEVGRLATQLFPGGLEVSPGPRRWADVTSATEKLLSQRRPLYEGGFVFQGAACRVDILVPVEANQWDVLEVKSSTSVKDVHLTDLAFQAYVLEGSGLQVRDYYLVHLDSAYVRSGELELEELFHKALVSEEVRHRLPEVADGLEEIRGVLEQQSRPEVSIGLHCDEPYPCPLKSECFGFLPEHNVLQLYGGRKKGFALLDRGVLELAAIPEDFELSDKQQLQLETVRSGEAHMDVAGIKAVLATLIYPVSFFDIETVSTAVPRFDNTRPYQQLPFLFSIHRIEEPGGEARHFAFQVTEEGDPRQEFMRAARTSLGERGSIVAYNASFESRVLVESSQVLPEVEPWALDATDRFVDLLVPFRSFLYYHPEQMGSASLKKVLPAVAKISYDELEIREGEQAGREYLRVMQPGFDPMERARVLRDLEAYCSVDTLGLVAIVDRLSSAT